MKTNGHNIIPTPFYPPRPTNDILRFLQVGTPSAVGPTHVFEGHTVAGVVHVHVVVVGEGGEAEHPPGVHIAGGPVLPPLVRIGLLGVVQEQVGGGRVNHLEGGEKKNRLWLIC